MAGLPKQYQARSLILLGPFGTGKTHLAIAVAMRMIQLGYQAKFLLAQKLVNDYVNQSLSRAKMLNQLAKVDLLIIDEFGYLPYDAQAGPLFYQLISDCYEKKATTITSNKSLRAWPEVLHDVSLAGALIDRLMERGEVYLRGDSYRRYSEMVGFHVDACLPDHPEHKGKVERRVGGVRQVLEPHPRVFLSLEELQSWTDERLQRRTHRRQCPATGKSVHESWKQSC